MHAGLSAFSPFVVVLDHHMLLLPLIISLSKDRCCWRRVIVCRIARSTFPFFPFALLTHTWWIKTMLRLFISIFHMLLSMVLLVLVSAFVQDGSAIATQMRRIIYVTPTLTIPDKLFGKALTLREAITKKESIAHNKKRQQRTLVDDHAFSSSGSIGSKNNEQQQHLFFHFGRTSQRKGHGFIQAAVTAFSEHYPFVMRPQHIWILILQVVAEHVNQNSAALKSKWIATPGNATITLTVVKDSFALGKPNDWASVIFSEEKGNKNNFLNQIRSHTVEGAFEDMMLPLSGTTAIEKVSMGITVMSALQAYFKYRVVTSCGFPYIIMEGTLEDWQMIRKKAKELIQTRCLSSFAEKWLPALLSILDKFVSEYENAATSTKTVDATFWNSMVKRGATSGSGAISYFSGWINVFFPYLTSRYVKENRFAFVPYDAETFAAVNNNSRNSRSSSSGPDVNFFPEGMSMAPVTWSYFNRDIPLEFKSGFICAKQDPITKAITPELGWYIMRTTDARET
jgi:hypothetical protein